MKDEEKTGNGNGVKRSLEVFRLITPSLVTLCIFFLGGISFQLHRIDGKIFTHLTNHEIHIPREQVVSQAEFVMHCKFSNDEKKAMFERMEKMEDRILASLER